MRGQRPAWAALLSLATVVGLAGGPLAGGAAGAIEPSEAPATAAAETTVAADTDGDGLGDDFEERFGLTDPALRDSDGDGLGDGMEDHDGDGVGALGEQRYGTDPGDPDSDDDGVGDGLEDSDGDGASDAREQDRRPAPAGLEPEPRYAWWDRPPNYDDACHGDTLDPELHPCTYGVDGSETTVVLFGDSHALQWQPGLKIAAFEHGWQVVTLTKAACPPPQILSSRKEPEAGSSCEAWRAEALAWIVEHEPDVVLMTGGGRLYKLEDENGERIAEEARTAAWAEGLARTLETIAAATRPVVLADTPILRTNPATCLEQDPSDLVVCSTPRSAAIDPAFDLAEREVVEAAGATYADLNELVCPYSPCPLVFEDTLAWRNRDHITASFSEMLAPSLGRVVAEALARGSVPTQPGDVQATPGPAAVPKVSDPGPRTRAL
jgi:hypothetical protein